VPFERTRRGTAQGGKGPGMVAGVNKKKKRRRELGAALTDTTMNARRR